MDDLEFYGELKQSIIRRGATFNLVDTLAFVSELAERLEDDPIFGEFVPAEFIGVGSRKRALRLHGYTSLDESDGTVGLVVGSWHDSEEPEPISATSIYQMSGWLENFVSDAVGGNLAGRIAEANPAYELASLLNEQRDKISRIRIHVFCNQPVSSKFKEEIFGIVAGIPIERHVWDFKRIKDLYSSSREREALEIDFGALGMKGIPCIEAARNDRIRSFLCVIEGNTIADLFERYGSRLLEGNVRSFLGMKGGVNKGIRATIQDSPSLFFAYNNGIAATAKSVGVSESSGRVEIVALSDFQIVNGGQTTASILSARKKDKLSLAGVTVQMKLTEVCDGDSDELIPKIAQFANTQNKVAVADFFANHPLHRKLEEISRRMQVPTIAGRRVRSKWFYERSRGQFQNERLYLSKAKKDAFDLEFPSEQLVNKTDLAKFDSTWKGRPHWVSLGAQKNFMKFAGQFASSNADVSEGEYWQKISVDYGDTYYQEIVSVAILWKSVEALVSAGRGDWYLGDYRPQIVAYTLSFVFHSLRKAGMEFDLGGVWASQSVDAALLGDLKEVAILIQRELLSPPQGMTNVGEWTKKEACWDRVKLLADSQFVDFTAWCISKSESRLQKRDGRKQGQQDVAIDLQTKGFELASSGYWLSLSGWQHIEAFTSPQDRALILKASRVSTYLKIAVERDWKRLFEIKQKCEAEGFRTTESVELR